MSMKFRKSRYSIVPAYEYDDDSDLHLNLQKDVRVPFSTHLLPLDKLQSTYFTNLETGLTNRFAAELLKRNGPNTLSNFKPIGHLQIFRRHVFSRFHCLLWVCAILNLYTHFSDTWENSSVYLNITCLIIAAIIGVASYGIYQEMRNFKFSSGFENLAPKYSSVIREGIQICLPNSELVVGDIVDMKKGELVPADVRILECSSFETSMCLITESPTLISHQTVHTHKNPLFSENMAYFGCPITNGWAKGVVIKTGNSTEIGQIARLVTHIKKKKTLFKRDLSYSVKIICRIAIALGYLSFTISYVLEDNKLYSLIYMLGFVTANVPEGLFMTAVIYVKILIDRLKKRNCLVTSLYAVGNLSSVSVICTNKTDTLTQNRMSVSQFICDFKIYDKHTHINLLDPLNKELCLIACLNIADNNSKEYTHLTRTEQQISEEAVSWHMKSKRGAVEKRRRNPKVAEVPYNSVNKYQITIHQSKSDNYLLVMKGAPEIILEHCSTMLSSDTDAIEMTPTIKEKLLDVFNNLAGMGQHVIAYSELKLSPDHYPIGYNFDTKYINFPVNDLQFVGAISVSYPPRPEVKESIFRLKNAGIKVIMMTDDQPNAALAMSRKIGTITRTTDYDYALEHNIDRGKIPENIHYTAAIFTGDELRRMMKSDLKHILQKYSEICFASLNYQQQQNIVNMYQELDEVVAFIGNTDQHSPAIKKADIGIALKTSSEVSKIAADMILLDGFDGICKGIEESRQTFRNFKKSVCYLFSTNTAEMMPFVLYSMLRMPLPLSLMLIMLINLGLNLLPALSLAFEASEVDVMNLPLKNWSKHTLSKPLLYIAYVQIGFIQFLAGMFNYFIIFAEEGFFPKSLYNVHASWDTIDESVVDTYGRIWWYEERKEVERKAQTGYFIAVCFTQVSNLIICKANRTSIFSKIIWRNWVPVWAIIVQISLALAIVYVPTLHEVFGTESLAMHLLICPLPFCVLMIILDEGRRYIIRNKYAKWVEKEMAL